MECGQSEIRIAQPPVGGRLDGSRSGDFLMHFLFGFLFHVTSPLVLIVSSSIVAAL